MRLLESERLYVRRFTADDGEYFFRVNGDADVMRYIRAPKTRSESDEFLQQVIANYQKIPTNYRTAIFSKVDDQFIGSFSILPVDDSDDLHIGYALLKEHWGKGYATEITKAGMKYAIERLELDSIKAIVEPGNLLSVRVLEKCGFQLEKSYDSHGTTLHLYQSPL